MDGNKQKHLEFIQGVIDRMARNSFFIRSWVVTLLVGILVVSATSGSDVNFRIFLLAAAILVMCVLWFMDAYFIAQERRYKKFYDEVRKKREWEVDFVMDSKRKLSFLKAAFTPISAVFHLSIILITYFSYLFLILGLLT